MDSGHLSRLRGPNRRFAPLLVGLLAFAGAAAVALRDGVPRPVYHDELAYLLAADTFAHGRLSMPAHPLWRHFETFHVLHQPTYASKYPPGQGLLLAAGQLAGHPILGVWLGGLLMCAAITWMLGAFVPPRWVLFGGLLAVVQVGVLSYWAQGYWGGSLAAAAGAAVFGALPRIVRRPAHRVRTRDVLGLGAGLIVLANTRPFEGALVSLAAAVPLWWWLSRGERPRRWTVVGLPLVAILAAGAIAMMVYHRAVTGDPLRLPYSAHNDAYLVQPLFTLQPLRPIPEYRHDVIRRYFAEFEVAEFQSQQSLGGWARTRWGRLERSRGILLGPVLTLGLLALPWSWRSRGVALAAAAVALLLLAVAATMHHYPHYAAPVLGPLVLLVVQGWRRVLLGLTRWLPRPRRARAVRLLVLLVVTAALAARLAAPDPVIEVGRARSANRAKTEVEQTLQREGGRHLVLVRHGRFADIHDEWVANGADIDAGAIVWARAMTPAEDDALRAYYPDRRAWRIEIAMDRPGVVDFSEIVNPAAPQP